MEPWPRVIVEWVNCLDVLGVMIKEVTELNDGRFYRAILNLMSWKNQEDAGDQKDVVLRFIEEEYPEFQPDDEYDKEIKQMYIASLYLLYASQNTIFHKPMCNNLHHETQLKIKTFLEMVIPYGNTITVEILRDAITELNITAPKTPVTPKTKGLRDFLSSPAVHSVQSHKVLTERNRELRKLKNELETERFEKADLQEDLEIYKSKLQNLQKKLQEKTAELKAMKVEEFKQHTPQSCKKQQNNTKQDFHINKEIDRLEHQLMEKQFEIDTLMQDKEKLAKQLHSSEKQCLMFKDKVLNCEKTIENLHIQCEIKDKEAGNLKLTNEELRMYLKELSKPSSAEESFEIDGIRPLQSSISSLNNSEVMSTVIELQLNEAREEANIWKGQVETLNKTVESMNEEHQRLLKVNSELEKDVLMLQEVQAKLETALTSEMLLSKEIKELQQDQEALRLQHLQLEEQYASQTQELFEVKQEKNSVDQELSNMKEKYEKLNIEFLQAKEHNERIVSAKDNEIRKLTEDLDTQTSCLNSVMARMEGLERNLKMTRDEVIRRETELCTKIEESQAQLKETSARLKREYEKLEESYDQEQICRKEYENKFVDSEKKLKTILNLKSSLESQLSEKQELIDELQLQLTKAESKVNELNRNLEHLRLTLHKKEEQYEDALRQKITELESLESDNAKLKTELNNTTSKLQFSQQEISNVNDQIKLKNERIEGLVSDLNLLKVEKDHLMRLQAEVESKTKTFVEQLEVQILEKQRSYDQLALQIKLKEDTIELLQSKLESTTKEKISWMSTELKMKEVIMNLQEVRSNQDAVLQTQEKALKEKTQQIEELHKEFETSKDAWQKEVEGEKALNRAVQVSYSELQKQSLRQVKTIEELEESLKKERNEHNAIKEQCRSENMIKLELTKACGSLGGLIDDLKSTIKDATQDVNDIYTNAVSIQFSSKNEELRNIFNIIQSAINEMLASRKLISHLYNTNVSLRESLDGQNILKEKYDKGCKEIQLLKSKISKLEGAAEKHVKHFKNLVQQKSSLQESLQSIIKSRETVDVSLSALEKKWKTISAQFRNVTTASTSLCDELKCIQIKKEELQNVFYKHNICHSNNLKHLNSILWEKFLWTEEQLEQVYTDCNSKEENEEFKENSMESTFSKEKSVIDSELEKNLILQKDIAKFELELDEFSKQIESCVVASKLAQVEFEASEKLQAKINELLEEKNDLESKLEAFRIRCTRLDNETEELKKDIAVLKSETVPVSEAESLQKDLNYIKEENKKLLEENEGLNKRPKKEEFEKHIKELQDKYEAERNEMKQMMKSAYNQQIAKLHKDQEKCLQEKLECLQGKMEQQCRKQADEINRYKAHVSELSSQFWNVGEKLLTEQQQKQELEKELNELKAKYQNMKLQLNQQVALTNEQKPIKSEGREFSGNENMDQILPKGTVLKDRASFERRCSIQSLQTMGNAFNAEDEEGEVFDNIYLADIKNDHQSSFTIDPDRLSVLKIRNSMCKPHLKSSYPAETQFNPFPFTEEEIKCGGVEEVFNDSLSQSLLPEQKTKKKDKTQTSYRKPGPPTPSRNGGRSSLQGNELKSPNSKVLRERNKERSTTTPRTLKSLFTSKRQDENTIVTPRGRRRSSIFRKARPSTNR